MKRNRRNQFVINENLSPFRFGMVDLTLSRLVSIMSRCSRIPDRERGKGREERKGEKERQSQSITSILYNGIVEYVSRITAIGLRITLRSVKNLAKHAGVSSSGLILPNQVLCLFSL